jgi:hypothetical protein
MKTSGLTVFSSGVLAASLVLAGCDNAGIQSQSGSSQARSQTSIPNIHRATGTGQKKVGQYWWVWNTVEIPPQTTQDVYADCPVKYIPTGGGYVMGHVEGNVTYASYPVDDGLNVGWVATVWNVSPAQNLSVEAWAICAQRRL